MSMSEAQRRRLGSATRCIHAVAAVDPEPGAIKRPIVLGNSFKLADTMAELPDAFNWDMPHSHNYPRSRHPNGRYLEERLASLEGGEDFRGHGDGVGVRWPGISELSHLPHDRQSARGPDWPASRCDPRRVLAR